MNKRREYLGARRDFGLIGMVLCLGMMSVFAGTAYATENGGSVYPIGAETVLPGFTPPANGTQFFYFTTYISANQVDDKNGNAIPTEFRLRVYANAVKIEHNWGVNFLGGNLQTTVAIPFLSQDLHVTPGNFSKFAVGNIDLSPVGVSYATRHWHFFYEADLYFPGTGRSSNDVLNIGQNNYALGPVGAVTYLYKKEELSSRLQYFFNREDAATHYQSGNEFTWEFDGMHAISKKVAVGVNGYLYKQTTDDLLDSVVFNDGNRGRALAIGPEIRLNVIPHGGLAFKYLHEMLIENRPPTNGFWFQFSVPIGIGHKE